MFILLKFYGVFFNNIIIYWTAYHCAAYSDNCKVIDIIEKVEGVDINAAEKNI